MTPALGIAIVLLIGWLNSGDEAVDRVVLLPGPDDKVGKVQVRTPAGEHLLDTPYAAAEIETAGRIVPQVEDAAGVARRYGEALAARPPRPVSFRVYFISGGDTLTPESLPVVEALMLELKKRVAAEVTVVGHTDRVGKIEDNDRLSRRRAETVRDLLLGQGVVATSIEATGRGEREPLVPTDDEVDEPRNRRVEMEFR